MLSKTNTNMPESQNTITSKGLEVDKVSFQITPETKVISNSTRTCQNT